MVVGEGQRETLAWTGQLMGIIDMHRSTEYLEPPKSP